MRVVIAANAGAGRVRLGELVAGIAALSAGGSPDADAESAALPGGGSPDADVEIAAPDVEIAALAYDSRRVGPGTMFCCVPGFKQDGHEFAAQAVRDGAAALLVERRLGLAAPEALVASVRAAMGPLAARLNGDPTRTLKVVGVTGTNGKTTSAYMVRALLEAAGVRTGLLGTVTSIVGGRERAVARTTPEAIDLQADFRAMLDGDEEACAMEVSSHALALGRTNAIEWAAALFTNLTQDHLDYHESMEDYYRAKRRLFLPDPALQNAWPGDHPPAVSVVNVGDAYGRRLAGEIAEASGQGPVTFAVEGARGGDTGADADTDTDAYAYAGTDADTGADTDYLATDVRCDASGCAFRLNTPEGMYEIELPMPGRFNVANAVGALAVARALSEAGRHPFAAGTPAVAGDLDTLVATIERGVHVPGRFEPVRGPTPAKPATPGAEAPTVIVDYAHTPDSLENVLAAAREITEGRVVCVFGAGGDRDRGKRPLMGEIAARLADVAVVTSDNPRSERPEAIVEEIVAGIPSEGIGARAAEAHVEVDRRRAIAWAIERAGAEDVVVIAGKGHEQGQELAGGAKVPFDDRVVAEEALKGRSHRAIDPGEPVGTER